MAVVPLIQPQTGSPRKKEIYYPESDGKPVESDEHRIVAAELLAMLADRYEDTDTYLSGNNGLYYVESDLHKVVSPDAYVVFGIGSQARSVYKVWENKDACPAIVFEFTSKKTKNEDQHKKRELYEQVLKVPEYVLFDPKDEYLKPRLQGFRLQQGIYVPIEMKDGRLYSQQLQAELYSEGTLLRLRDPKTGQVYPTRREKNAALEVAEAEIERLRALLAAQKQ